MRTPFVPAFLRVRSILLSAMLLSLTTGSSCWLDGRDLDSGSGCAPARINYDLYYIPGKLRIVYHDTAAEQSHAHGNAVATDAVHRILVAGWRRNSYGLNEMALWRFDANGTLDATFGSGGLVAYTVPGFYAHYDGNAIALENPGDPYSRIVVAGSRTDYFGNSDLALWRYTFDGKPDPSLNGTGFVTHDNAAGGNGVDEGRALALDAQGRILVAGKSKSGNGTFDLVIWRYHSWGLLDSSFGNGGVVVQHNAAGGNGDDYGNAMAIDSMGRIVVTGFSNGTFYRGNMVLWRYTADGALDGSFGAQYTSELGNYGTGIVTYNDLAGFDVGYVGNAIALDAAGRILVAGERYSNIEGVDTALWRYDGNGAPDPTFGTNGVLVYNGGAKDVGNAIAVDGAGTISVTGYRGNSLGHDDMTLDYFTSAGLLTSALSSSDFDHLNNDYNDTSEYGNALALDAQGSPVVAGFVKSADGQEEMVLWAYKP